MTGGFPPADAPHPAPAGADPVRLQRIGAVLRQAFDLSPDPPLASFNELLRRIDEADV